MKATMKLLSLAIVLLSFSSCLAQEAGFECEPAADWTALFDRTNGWLAGDGIYSFGLEGVSTQGSANETSQTLFTFGDSFIGSVNADGSFKSGLVMVNHCFAQLEGDKPDPAKMRFLYNTDAENRPANLFDRNYWLGDSIVIDGTIHTTGIVVDPKSWAMEGPWMLTVPIRDNKPDFTAFQSHSIELFHKNGPFEVLFGIGICDQGNDIYVYGFRDERGKPFYRRQLVVAKAPRKTYTNIATWSFWTGKTWSPSIAECNCDEAALAEGMSNELSVTKMIGGRYDGKFVLVYTDGCVSEKLNFSVADTPNGKFYNTTTFYTCPEPKQFEADIKKTYGPDAHVITYNAKAHPRLSKPGELLVSYNLNIWGMKDGMFFVGKDQAYPRFVRLRLP